MKTYRLLIVGLTLLSGPGVGTLSHAQDPPPEGTKRILLLSQGPDGHPAETHEYVAGMRVIGSCLSAVPHLQVDLARVDDPWPDGPDLIRRADGVVIYLAQGARWVHQDPLRLEAFAQHAARGGGLVALHWGMGTTDDRYVEGFLKLFGGCHGGTDRRYAFLTTDVMRAQEEHEILHGISDFEIHDEFYYQLKFVAAEPTVKPILKAKIEGEAHTVAWAWERSDGGRSFGFSGAHFHDNWRRQEYRRLVTQGVLWALKLPVPAQGLDVTVDEKELKITDEKSEKKKED